MSVIEDFRQIAKTGDLLPGYRWHSIEWHKGEGWLGWVHGPNGANDWIVCKKIPKEILEDL